MDRVRSKEKSASASKLDAAKQTLKANGSPAQSNTPLTASPRIEGMQIDGEDVEGTDYGSEPGTPNLPSVPLPQNTAVKVCPCLLTVCEGADDDRQGDGGGLLR